MSTEVSDYKRLRLWLFLLFVASFVVSLMVLRPAVVQSLVAIAPSESVQELVRATLVPRADIPVESTTDFDVSEPPVAATSTLQDLAADSDPETRLEAQALLALVDEEAAADYR